MEEKNNKETTLEAEVPRCPYCKGELRGRKKKCPICHRSLTETSTNSKTNKPEIKESKEAGELPEDVKNLIAKELAILKDHLESFTAESNDNMSEFVKTQIDLLKSNPIKYFTGQKQNKQETLDFVVHSKEYTAEEKLERASDWGKEIEKLERVINVLSNEKTPENKKEKKIAELKKKIKNSEKIIEGSSKREQEILARLAELEKEIKKEEE